MKKITITLFSVLYLATLNLFAFQESKKVFIGNPIEIIDFNSDFSTDKNQNQSLFSAKSIKENNPKTIIKIYPNPSSDFIQISGLAKREYYFIYNTAGAIVTEGGISNKEKINIKNLSKGMYFINLTNGIVSKFTKI